MWHVWSRGHCCHAVTRDEEIILPRHRCSGAKVLCAGLGTGWPFWPLVRPRLSQLVMASGNNYWCINILKVSLSKLMNSSNHAPWLTVAVAAEIRSRVAWWWWWWQCWCWLLTSSSRTTTLVMPILAICLYTLMLSLFFLFTLDCCNYISQ